MDIRRLARLLHPNLSRPIFIVGAARSGTTFLGQCLAAVPEISYHYEPAATRAAARYVAEGQWTKRGAARFYRNVYSWLMRLHLDADLRFAEKTPRNSYIMEFLAEAFPDAQFVHIIRDGRDAALSYRKKRWLSARPARPVGSSRGDPIGPYTHYWIDPHRVSKFESTSDIHRCIWAWRRMTERALDVGSRLPAWRYYEVRYEALVSHPNREAERVLDFLSIHRPESRTRFLQDIAQVRTASVGRWRVELSSGDLAEIDGEAGDLLAQLGYST